MTTPQPPRGTQDFLHPDSERFEAHEERSRVLFSTAGYRRIITPMFEDTEVFARGVGEGSDIVAKEMYTFTDRSGNSLTLRPEGTAPVIRAVISNHLWDAGVPIKLWYSAAMFRYDRPQKGRFRQHHQIGIEAIGTDDPAIDAEVIALGGELLARAGVTQTSLRINSIGHPAPECRDAHRAALVEFLQKHRDELDDDCRRRMETNPLRVFDCKNPNDQKILEDAPTVTDHLCEPCRTHFSEVQSYLKDLGMEFTISPRLVRGLDYYTRTAFEFVTPLLEAAQSTVLAGGRYDGLSETLGGPRLPGIGFGSGIERVLIAASSAGAEAKTRRLDCFVVPLSAEERSAAFTLTWALRRAGGAADLAYGDRNLKANLKQADRLGARYAALIGANERAAGACTMRDMTSGEQVQVPLTDAPSWLAEHVK
jgi:histidyl-tRNA synthetase